MKKSFVSEERSPDWSAPVSPNIADVVREILTLEKDLAIDHIMQAVRQRGITESPEQLRPIISAIRAEMKQQNNPTGEKPTAAARRAAKLARNKASSRSHTSSDSSPSPSQFAASMAPTISELPDVLSNVALVSQVMDMCGGAEHAAQAAEAIRSCGGVDQFLQYLKLITKIRYNEQN